MPDAFALDFSIYQIVGLLGAAGILLRYICVAFDRLTSQSPWYYLTNLMATSLIMVSLLHTFNLVAAVVQTVYIAVSLIGVCRHLRPAQRPPRHPVRPQSAEPAPAGRG